MSLFPFLAVLICTMGSLIVLLVVVVQQARNVESDTNGSAAEDNGALAATAEPPASENSHNSDSLELEDLRWQAEGLRKSREATSRRLREAQLQLSLAEDLVRQLNTQLDRLEREAQAFEAARDRRLSEQGSMRDELSRVQAEIERVTQEWDQVHEATAAGRRSFAIIPYRGQQGTDRRPIYVECLADRVIIQPEGVVLESADFPEAMGPDNALGASLRATREHWLNTRVLASSSQAYPLLLVRPGGAHTYAACRHALRSWDDEFGYELLPTTMDLTFPPADPSLRAVLEATLQEVRARRQPNELGAIPGSSGRPSAGRNQAGFGGSSASAGQGADSTLSGSSPTSKGPQLVGGMPDGRPGLSGSGEGQGMPGPDLSQNERGARALGEPEDAAGSAAGRGTAAPNGSSEMEGTESQGSFGASLAETRGENWALPNSAQGSIGMSRPVRVRVESGRLILIPESASAQQPVTFDCGSSTDSAVGPFVEAIWKRIESWGVAGPGAYWKPVLQLEVTPDGEATYRQVERLLHRSGLVLERRSLERGSLP